MVKKKLDTLKLLDPITGEDLLEFNALDDPAYALEVIEENELAFSSVNITLDEVKEIIKFLRRIVYVKEKELRDNNI